MAKRRASGTRARKYKQGPCSIFEVAKEFKALAADFLLVQDAALRAVNHAIALAEKKKDGNRERFEVGPSVCVSLRRSVFRFRLEGFSPKLSSSHAQK